MEGYFRRFFDGYWAAIRGRGIVASVCLIRASPITAGRGLPSPDLGAKTALEAAITAALSRSHILLATIVLLAKLHYTSPNFPGYGHLTT